MVDVNSLFAWSGAGCSGAGDCVINSLSADTAVTATFNYVQPARINSTYYDSLQEAYADANEGAVIEARAFTFTGPLELNSPIDVTLKGGYDLNYTPGSTDYSVVTSKLAIKSGSVKVQRIVVR